MTLRGLLPRLSTLARAIAALAILAERARYDPTGVPAQLSARLCALLGKHRNQEPFPFEPPHGSSEGKARDCSDPERASCPRLQAPGFPGLIRKACTDGSDRFRLERSSLRPVRTFGPGVAKAASEGRAKERRPCPRVPRVNLDGRSQPAAQRSKERRRQPERAR